MSVRIGDPGGTSIDGINVKQLAEFLLNVAEQLDRRLSKIEGTHQRFRKDAKGNLEYIPLESDLK